MKSKSLFYIAFAVLVAGVLGSSTSLFAQNMMQPEKIKYEDYQVMLQNEIAREAAANTRIEQLKSEIAALQAQLDGLNNQITQAQNRFWSLLDSNEQGFANFMNVLNQLRSQIQGLLNLAPGELYKRGDEVMQLESRFNTLLEQKVSKHPDAQATINDIRNLLARLKTQLANAQPPFEPYTVMRGDYLWKISAMPNVYGNGFQWVRIWTKNRDLITNPDMIYPGQVFKIFQDVLENEHMVVKGENLSKIAGYPQVYNDPFKWSQLYEMNKTVIADKDLIYPYMILYIR